MTIHAIPELSPNAPQALPISIPLKHKLLCDFSLSGPRDARYTTSVSLLPPLSGNSSPSVSDLHLRVQAAWLEGESGENEGIARITYFSVSSEPILTRGVRPGPIRPNLARLSERQAV